MVAQLFVVRASGHLFDRQREYPHWEPPMAILRHLLEDLGIGGVIFVGGSAGDLMLRSHQVQSLAKYPLLIAADIEEGVGQRFAGATWFAPPMAISEIAQDEPELALQYAEEMGAAIAKEAEAIGINWVLAPVVDVNNNPQNPVINVRAFGETPETVSQLATAFLRGQQGFAVLTCAKHFPGHGDTSVDSHVELPVLPHSIQRLEQIELPPFIRAIAAGVDAVMSAHLLIPAWDSQQPATLSRKILTGQLRQKLGFEGLIVTDALVMGAIAKRYGANEAPILALEAGADILLMPEDPVGAIRALCEAVRAGRISETRIRESVQRIWKAKGKLFPEAQVVSASPERLSVLSAPQIMASAEKILRQSQQVGGSLPLPQSPGGEKHLRNLLIVDDIINCAFLNKAAPAIAFPQSLGYKLQLVDCNTASNPELEKDNSSVTLLQMFIRGNPFGGPARVTSLAYQWVKKLLRNGQLQAISIYGSPYVLKQLQPDLPPEIPYVFSYGQMSAAQAIALETLFGRELS
ncbi:glycoside hydrolase family 3 protein [Phormidium sp. CCY1219]|uniref:glycoside hydrolase family 3 protein n=1 Tax=Phormidium sp. CCY1219 TaxID=2886104 RepID=UPI002D1E6014|nr:glycoside hydrolase family 3 N-terminal domain-containing protein [Phormidium sp. CCY1219]MEB3831853.1 beta-glucosidase [Phormidium sp. CCY1219]